MSQRQDDDTTLIEFNQDGNTFRVDRHGDEIHISITTNIAHPDPEEIQSVWMTNQQAEVIAAAILGTRLDASGKAAGAF